MVFKCLIPVDNHYFKLLFFSSGTVFIAAMGYLINDYFDIEIDKINRPEKKGIGENLSKSQALLIYFLGNGLALLFALQISTTIFYWFLLHIFLLFGYSYWAKCTFLIGNLIVAFCTSSTIFLIIFLYKTQMLVILSYSFFAFLATLIREIVKDREDLKGDSHQDCYTLATTLSLDVLRIVLLILGGLKLGFWLIFSHFFNFSLEIILGFSGIIIFFLYKSQKSKSKEDFARLSLYSKLTMVGGLLTMVKFME